MRRDPPLELEGRSGGLQGARAALAPPSRRRLPAWVALLCAGLMAVAATALAAVVVLGGWEPDEATGGSAVRGELSAR